MNIISKAFLIFLLYFPGAILAAETQLVLGAGPSTAIATLFFEHFSKLPVTEGIEFQVEQRSIKHAGGIRASNKYLFGRTGRPLNEKEKRANKQEIFLARIPLSIVVGDSAGVTQITRQQLADIFTRKIINWKEVGGADLKIMLIGREPTEAAFMVLKKDHPFFSTVTFDRIFTRDHQVVNFIKSSEGRSSISFGARSNFDNRNLLEVEGFASGVSVGLVVDHSRLEHPIVKAAIEYARSDEWRRIVLKSDFLPIH